MRSTCSPALLPYESGCERKAIASLWLSVMDTSPRNAPLKDNVLRRGRHHGNLTGPASARQPQGLGSLRPQLLQIRYDVFDRLAAESGIGHRRVGCREPI